MSMPIDETKLSAYALGELAEPERSALEAELSHNAEARRLLDELRQTAGQLTRELTAETGPGLDEPRRREIERRIELLEARRRKHRPALWSHRLVWLPFLLIVAVLVIILVIAAMMMLGS